MNVVAFLEPKPLTEQPLKPPSLRRKELSFLAALEPVYGVRPDKLASQLRPTCRRTEAATLRSDL